MATRRKLAYDVTLPATAFQAMIFYPLRANGGPLARVEENGGNLEDLQALSGATPPRGELRRKNDVAAWFVPSDEFSAGVSFVDFVGDGSSSATNVQLPYLTVGGSVAAKAGHTPIFTRNWAVRLRTSGVSGEVAAAGRLYIQRLHSIEV